MDFCYGFDEVLGCGFAVESDAVPDGDSRFCFTRVLDEIIVKFHIFQLRQTNRIGKKRLNSRTFVMAFETLCYSLCFS